MTSTQWYFNKYWCKFCFCCKFWVLFVEVKRKIAKKWVASSTYSTHIHPHRATFNFNIHEYHLPVLPRCNSHTRRYIQTGNCKYATFSTNNIRQRWSNRKKLQTRPKKWARKKAAQIENSSHKKVVKCTKIAVMANVVVLAETVNTR